MKTNALWWAAAASLVASVCAPARAIDDAHRDRARAMASKAAAYLLSQQDEQTGGWSVPSADSHKPHLPAISALVLTGLIQQPGVDAQTPSVSKGVGYIASKAQRDGGIYDAMLPTYNTAISLSALCKIDDPRAAALVKPAQEFLKRSQWGAQDASADNAGGKEAPVIAGTSIDEKHPFFGGWGYGNRGRPDISNTQFVLQAFRESELPREDPAYKRAVVFLQRVQMLDTARDGQRVNDQPYAKGSRQGGFIYATAENQQTIGQGQSFAGTIDETLDDGTTVSKLRAYASVTYAGFKSYLYAGLSPDDPRVLAAMDWISRNYDLTQNPGIGADGQYYFYVAMARALGATGKPTLSVIKDDRRETRDWHNDLIDQLATLQNDDGSFKSVKGRWMEDNPVLITAYALIALSETLR